MRDFLVFAAVFGLLPLVIFRTHVGVYLWNWIAFFNPHRLTWGYAYQFQFAYIIGIVTFISLIFSKERKRLPNHPLVYLLVAFCLWMTLTTFFALVPDDAWWQWQKVMKIQLFIFISLLCLQDQKRLHTLVVLLCLSIGFYGLKGGIFTLSSGGHHLVLGPKGSQIEDNNTLALAIIMILPLMIYCYRQTIGFWKRNVVLLAIFLNAISVFGSHSRGALVAAGASLTMVWVYSKRKLRLFIILLMLMPLILMQMPEKWFDRMATISTYEEDASAKGRLNAWAFAYNLALDRPLLGGGFETFRPRLFERYAPVSDDVHDSHSIYFEILGEHGFVGLSLFLSIIVLTWRNNHAIRRLATNNKEAVRAYELATMLQVSLVGYLVGGAFLGVSYFDLFYTLVAISILTRKLLEQELKQYETIKTNTI